MIFFPISCPKPVRTPVCSRYRAVSLLPFLLFHLIVATLLLINTALAISMPTVAYLDPYLPQDHLSGVMARKPLGQSSYYLHWLYNAFFIFL